MKSQKMGDPIISDLDIFFCSSCQRKLILVGDKTEFRMRTIAMYCLKCRENIVMTIQKI